MGSAFKGGDHDDCSLVRDLISLFTCSIEHHSEQLKSFKKDENIECLGADGFANKLTHFGFYMEILNKNLIIQAKLVVYVTMPLHRLMGLVPKRGKVTKRKRRQKSQRPSKRSLNLP